MLVDKILGRKIIVLDLRELSFVPFLLPIKSEADTRGMPISWFISTRYRGADELKPFRVKNTRQFPVEISHWFFSTDLFLSPHMEGRGYRKAIKVNVSHNQPVKWLLPPPGDFSNYDVHFLTGPLNREQVEQAIREYGFENRSICLYDIGYPKLDEMLNRRWDRNAILDSLGLDSSRKTVIYAPSWDEGLSLRTFGVRIIDALLELENLNLIIKLHPISTVSAVHPCYLLFTGGIDWRSQLEKYRGLPNVCCSETAYINPLLFVSDLLVTDVSSVALEYVFLQRPMVFYDSRFYFERILPTFYRRYGNDRMTASEAMSNLRVNGGRNFGRTFRDLAEMKIAIREGLENPRVYSGEDKATIRTLLYNPGNASREAANVLGKLLGLAQVCSARQ